MNFGKTIKEEILSKPPKDRCCKKSFLLGLIRGTGVIFDDGSSFGVDFSVADEETVILISNYLKILYDYDLREVSATEDRLNKKDRFTLTLSGEKAELILMDLGIFNENNGDLEVNLNFIDSLKKECCIRSFFRGLFLSIGNCTVPSKEDSNTTGYHLELVFSHYTSALEVSEKLAESDVLTKITRRKDTHIVYIKSCEEIKNFCAFLGTPVSVLKITDLMINRDISNNSNRQRNCDMGNASRQADAVNKQLMAIEKIESVIGIETLKEDLRYTAKARKDNPDDTLIELSEKLNVTKSCLNHRLRKIVCIAEEL